MKILHLTTCLILHTATCLAVLNKGSISNLNEASEANADAQQAGYQYNGPTQQYLPTYPQQGYQYVVPVAHHQPDVALVGSPLYQYASATQALAVDDGAGLPNKLPESDTYYIANDQHQTVPASVTNKPPVVNVNPGYAPPDYHSANYYVPRQIQQQQNLVSQQDTANVAGFAAAASNRPYVSAQDHEYYLQKKPDQRGTNGESLNEFAHNDYTNNVVTSNHVPQFTSNDQYSNDNANSQAEDCASSHTTHNLQKDNDFQTASQAAQTLPDFSAYPNVRPIYQSVNHVPLTTVNIGPGNTQTFPQAISSSYANSQKGNDYSVKFQILPNLSDYQNERPYYQSVSPTHVPAEHQGLGNSQVGLQATNAGLTLPQPAREVARHGHNYRYQQPFFNPSIQSNINELNPHEHQAQQNENNYVSNTAPTSATSLIYEPTHTLPASHHFSPLHTQVPITSIPNRARPVQIPNTAYVPNYAVNHKGLGHYSYSQSRPIAITAKDDLLTGEQHQQFVKPSTGGRDYLQMQSQSYELPTYTSMYTELPIATDYAKQRIQGSQILAHYPAHISSNQPLSGLVVPHANYRLAASEGVATPSNTYLSHLTQ